MNKFGPLLILALTHRFCLAQSVSPQVIGTAGDFFVSSSGSLAWTIGETIVETYKQGEGYFTQGFHQPSFLTVTEVADQSEFGIFPYPNPTTQSLNLKITQAGNYKLELYDLTGIKLMSFEVSVDEPTESHRIDLQPYAPALYLLRVTKLNSGESFGFRIERL